MDLTIVVPLFNEDESLGDAISVTIIATGFNMDQQNVIAVTESKKIVHTIFGILLVISIF